MTRIVGRAGPQDCAPFGGVYAKRLLRTQASRAHSCLASGGPAGRVLRYRVLRQPSPGLCIAATGWGCRGMSSANATPAAVASARNLSHARSCTFAAVARRKPRAIVVVFHPMLEELRDDAAATVRCRPNLATGVLRSSLAQRREVTGKMGVHSRKPGSSRIMSGARRLPIQRDPRRDSRAITLRSLARSRTQPELHETPNAVLAATVIPGTTRGHSRPAKTQILALARNPETTRDIRALQRPTP